MKKNNIKSKLKNFWNYLWYDESWGSYFLSLFVALIFIKFLLFPFLGMMLNNDYPIVAIVSGSMEHKIVSHRVCDKIIGDVKSDNLNLDEWWGYCGDYYEQNFDIEKDDFNNFVYKNGLNIGDVMILYGKSAEDIDIGDVLVFVPEDRNFFETKGPVIHRVVVKWQDETGKYHFTTKGDHNPQSLANFEQDITQDDVIGVGVFRIPFIGYVKLAFNNILMWIIGLF